MKQRHLRRKSSLRRQRGTSLLEVLMASVVFIVGMIGVLSLFLYAAGTAGFTDGELVAKQKARDTMESIYGARNSSVLGFASVNNIGTNDDSTGTPVPGIFLKDWHPLYASGADGIAGTADDVSAGIETITAPDGSEREFSDFERKIEISPFEYTVTSDDGEDETVVAGNLKRIIVSIRFKAGPFGTRTYTMTSLISQYK